MQAKKFIPFIVLLTAATAFAQTKPALDGQIWFSAKDAPAYRSSKDSDLIGPGEKGTRFKLSSPKSSGTTLFERTIARWKDPTTLPHSREECVSWAHGDIPFDGEWKTCNGWKVQWQYMYTSAYVRVSTAKPEDISEKIDKCLNTAAVAGAVSGIVSGGSAAITTFEVALKACLVMELPSLVTVSAWTSSGWGDYE
jgi:hypothetical protein